MYSRRTKLILENAKKFTEEPSFASTETTSEQSCSYLGDTSTHEESPFSYNQGTQDCGENFDILQNNEVNSALGSHVIVFDDKYSTKEALDFHQVCSSSDEALISAAGKASISAESTELEDICNSGDQIANEPCSGEIIIVSELNTVLPKNDALNDIDCSSTSNKMEVDTDNGIQIWEEEESLPNDDNMPSLEFNSDDSIKDPDYEASSESEHDNSNNGPEVAEKIHITAETENRDITSESRLSRSERKIIKGETRKARSERKKLRNEGKEYKTKSGKTKNARKCKDLPSCRMKCREKIEVSKRKQIFEEFWKAGNHDHQVQYISGLISGHPKATSRNKVDKLEQQKNRLNTYNYFVELNGQRSQICKKCFMTVFDITNRFITEVIKNKNSSTSGLAHMDMRGKSAPYNKTSEENLNLVRLHISLIPTYESHYTRKDSTRKYIPHYYSLKRLYMEYKVWLEPGKTPVSQTIYEREFKKTGIKIKRPNKDTCAACDKLQMLIKNSTNANREKLKEDLKVHQTEADYAYNSKKDDKKMAENDPSKLVYTFDLQQCLPTPDIKTSVAFYKRQLWTYNLTVHRCKYKQCYCFMWHECIAGRGANQIASCLYKHFQMVPNEITDVTLYSDTCGGQNKNSYMLIMFSLVMKINPHVKYINHKFLVPGHTHMECDSDHSIIEKKKKTCDFSIDHPRDWMQLVRMCGKKQNFIVEEMKRGNFFEFSSLFKQYFQNKKLNEDGEKVVWKDIKWFRYSQTIGIVEYKTTLNPDDEFKKINILRKKNELPNSVITVPLSYKGPVPITIEKKKNLIELLPYVDEAFHAFYHSLPTKQGAVDALIGDSGQEDNDN